MSGLMRLRCLDRDHLRDNEKHAASHMAITSPGRALLRAGDSLISPENAAAKGGLYLVRRSLWLRMLWMQTGIELLEFFIFDEAQWDALNDERFVASRFR